MKSFETVRVLSALGISLSLLAGCSGGETSETGEGPSYARDIQPLINAKCAICHTEGSIAPFPLETYEQVNAMKGPVAAAVAARTMPPWMADGGCTDYRGDRSLSDEQIDLIRRWVDAGAPEGDPNDTPVPVEDEQLTLSRVDLELPIPEPYTPELFPDDYRCFFLDWPSAEATYITGFGAEPDNKAIVHHLIAYVVSPEGVPIFQALDDAAAGPGWPCFGGPGGDETPGSGPKVSWIGGWAPGGTGQDFPEGTGIEIPAGSKLIVQVHYNTSSAPPAPDRTKILVRTDATVDKTAAVLPFANVQWLLGEMPIPAHSKDVVHSFTSDPSTLVSLFSGGALTGGKPLTVYSAGPHRHTRGTHLLTGVERADGTSECMLDVPHWNFHWQLQYNFETPKQLVPGDKIHLECHWDNPGDTDLNWGEGTDDEMCLGVFYLTE